MTPETSGLREATSKEDQSFEITELDIEICGKHMFAYRISR